MTALSIIGVAFFVVGLVTTPQRRRRRRRLTRRTVEQTSLRLSVRDAQPTSWEHREVATGAAALDRYFGDPTWDERIDLGRLRVASINDCVLGQLFGRYGFAPDKVYMVDGGFAGGSRTDRAWVDLISRRQAERREQVAA